MTQTAQRIFDAALALPEKERADLASRLIRSLDESPPDQAEQAEIDSAWKAEIERRVKEIDEGTARLIPADEVFAEIEQRLRKKP